MAGINGCWNDFCIASDCGLDSLQHVDATGYTWTQPPSRLSGRPGTAAQPTHQYTSLGGAAVVVMIHTLNAGERIGWWVCWGCGEETVPDGRREEVPAEVADQEAAAHASRCYARPRRDGDR